MELKYEKKAIYDRLTEKGIANMKNYTTSYLDFLNSAKTEYLCVSKAVEMLSENGFTDINEKTELKEGDKVYFVNKEKSIYAAIIGKEKLDLGMNIIGAHIDSPRLDLKPLPLYENNGVGYLKTQYYGGIKKYQWLTIPLAMYGVVYNEKGEKIEIELGTNSDEMCFTITDLLPHLGKDQMKKTAAEFIDPEKMSILFGSLKDPVAKKDKVKENILNLLYKKYGIKEIDFARSEIEFVPAFNAKYVGIDESMVGGYGQDDRVCAFATLKALIDVANSNEEINKTCVALLVDKEEIGSEGNTSMSSLTFDMFIKKIIYLNDQEEVPDLLEIYYNSNMLSADVTAALDPLYEEVSDAQNSSLLGYGVSIEKYTGGNGKSSSSDATAQYMSKVMNLFEKEKVVFQVGTIGKQEKGGGGTIAYILANKGVNVVDCGTAVLCMHSPFEVASEADIYMTYLAYGTFFKGM